MGYEFNLGTRTRNVTTHSAQAQLWFDRGLNWVYAFNHDEALNCFRAAIDEDPDCAMAWWGIAYAAGPFYNRVWARFSPGEIEKTLPVCVDAVQRAHALCENGSSVERALIQALLLRYVHRDERDVAVLNSWHRDYAVAMGETQARWPDDLDLATLYIEAAITCTPRMLWNLETGAPRADAFTNEVMAVLDDSLRLMTERDEIHPGIAHMQIHALEMSPFPERALTAAELLCGQMPDAGHLEHMPAHIYVLCGDYVRAVEQSHLAVAANDRYVDYAGVENFYTTARCHDLHLYMHAAMFLGQYNVATDASERIAREATPELIKKSTPYMATLLDAYSAMRSHVLVRFGKWRELTARPVPEDRDLFPISRAMHFYSVGVAHSALGEVREAEAALVDFRQARDQIDPEAVMLSNTVYDVLGVGEAMLIGELEYRKQNYDTAFEHLRLAVRRDDALNFTEPWAWMHPPRHALGALLCEQKHFDAAEEVFRQDLGLGDGLPRCCQHPDNIWAMHGLVECLEQRGALVESAPLRARLEAIRRYTDVEVTSSCCCRSRVAS